MAIKRAGTPRKSSIVDAQAECEVCGWQVEAGNAIGLAAQHFKRTGHPVLAGQSITVHYHADYATGAES